MRPNRKKSKSDHAESASVVGVANQPTQKYESFTRPAFGCLSSQPDVCRDARSFPFVVFFF